MPVLKEWTCECGHEFERIRPECPLCHSVNVTRAFRTPFGLQKGAAKRTDRILEHQFKKLGISNFSNNTGGGPNKVTWAPRYFSHSGGNSQLSHSSNGQEAILPGGGANFMQGLLPGGVTPTVEGSPFTPPMASGAGIPLGVPIGGPPKELFRRTNTMGGIDSDGKEIRRTM